MNTMNILKTAARPLVLALAFVAIGPSILAYRFWSAGVQRVGPSIAGFFSNLTPLFAALLSAAFPMVRGRSRTAWTASAPPPRNRSPPSSG